MAARFTGQSVPRKEDRRLVTGHGRYVDDVRRPGQLHAAFLRSEVAAATIGRSTSAATRARGGGRGLHRRAAQRRCPRDLLGHHGPGDAHDRSARPRPGPVRRRSGRHRGGRARGTSPRMPWTSSRWSTSRRRPLSTTGRRRRHHRAAGASRGGEQRHGCGAVHPHVARPRRGVLQAPTTSSKPSIESHRYIAVPMEPRGVLATWNPGTDELDVVMSTQSVHEVAGLLRPDARRSRKPTCR